jgi:glycosyltransferase involved in cell wall biosynthesis
MRRIVLICEVLKPPLDEGVRILAAELARAFARTADVTLIGSTDAVVHGMPVRGAASGRWFAAPALARALSAAKAEAILYVPWTSLTIRTFFRVAMLRRRGGGAPVAVVALQPRGAGILARVAARLGAPDHLFAAGPGVEAQARDLGLVCARLQGGVDLERFRPIGNDSRSDLRRALGLPVTPFIVLHVGHLKPGRGVMALRAVQALEGVQAVLVCSSSTEADTGMRRSLQAAGVRVVDRHVPEIEEYYRAADCYLFPPASSLDAIELPLSVLEAMACDLPIVTSRFGGLPALLEGAGAGVTWIASEEEIPRAIIKVRQDRPVPLLRDRASSLTWEAMAGRIGRAIEGAPTGPQESAAVASA